MTPEELRKRAAQVRWFHSYDFGPVQTKGMVPADHLGLMYNELKLPPLRGKTLLDIGAWDGYFSFRTEQAGAEVTALDSVSWNGDSTPRDKSGFQLAHEWYNSKVRSVHMEVCDISPRVLGTYDVVLFLGVLYHMRHPAYALERVASVARGLVVVESHVRMDIRGNTPMMVMYPGLELNNDPTNWYGPNPAAVITMMEMAGLKDCKMVTHRNGTDRMIFHGYVK